MSLEERIVKEMTAAMKYRQAARLSTLRMVKAAVQNREIEKGGELTDEEVVRVPGLASRWVRLPNGERAHYVTSGDEGPAVVLLHGGTEGNSGTSDWWRSILQ